MKTIIALALLAATIAVVNISSARADDATQAQPVPSPSTATQQPVAAYLIVATKPNDTTFAFTSADKCDLAEAKSIKQYGKAVCIHLN